MSSSYLFDLYTVDQTSSKDGTTGVGLLLIENRYHLNPEHEFYTSFNFIHTSGSPSDRLGDLQVASNIDAQGEETFKPYEIYWLGRTSIGQWMIGFIDLSNHYNLTQSSLVFIHSFIQPLAPLPILATLVFMARQFFQFHPLESITKEIFQIRFQ